MIWFCHKHTLGVSFFCLFVFFFKQKTQDKCSENVLTEQDRIIEYFTHGWGSVSSTEQIWKDPQTFIYMSKYQMSWEGRFPKHTVHAKVSKAAWAMQCKKQQGKPGIKTRVSWSSGGHAHSREEVSRVILHIHTHSHRIGRGRQCSRKTEWFS